MTKAGDTQHDLASSIGISPSRLNAKINGKDNAEFWQTEIAHIGRRYKLSAEDVNQIFFAKQVSKKDTTNEAS